MTSSKEGKYWNIPDTNTLICENHVHGMNDLFQPTHLLLLVLTTGS